MRPFEARGQMTSADQMQVPSGCRATCPVDGAGGKACATDAAAVAVAVAADGVVAVGAACPVAATVAVAVAVAAVFVVAGAAGPEPPTSTVGAAAGAAGFSSQPDEANVTTNDAARALRARRIPRRA